MTLKVSEIFVSLQGETTYAGLACGFVRLAGCNLDCRYCDTRYARRGGDEMSVAEVVERLDAFDTELVSVTGGEPLLQDESVSLMTELADRGHTVLLETNGSVDIGTVDPRVVRIVDIKCPGSNMDTRNLWSNLAKLRSTDQVKFVITSRTDYEYMIGVVADHDLCGRLEVLASPAVDLIDPALLAGWLIEERSPIRLQLQLHRLIWPDRRKGA
jgi:7-carboxy-7-deazaguanine synthase